MELKVPGDKCFAFYIYSFDVLTTQGLYVIPKYRL